MNPEEFREAAHEVVDWIADYLRDVRELPVLPGVEPGELTDSLPASAPDNPEPMDRILSDFRSQIVPAVTHWNHPRFHAYFSVSASGPGILGEMLTAALNTNGMVWKSSPASTELEQVTLGWIREWLGLPPEWFGIIYDTASVSTMHAIAAARERACPEARERGGSQDLVLYTSEHAHSSVEMGAIAIGTGQRNVRKIGVDTDFRMRTDLLRAAMAQDAAKGLKPFCVVPTIGTTSTTSIDPVREAIAIASEHSAWVHVDAAYGGAVCASPKYQQILEAVAGADSLVMNPHKWFFTPIDVSVFYTKHADILKRAFSLVPEYLRTNENPRALNYMDYGVPLGRRFRALKLWFVLRSFGRKGIAEIIEFHIEWAKQLAALMEAHPQFELCAPVTFSLICFRMKGTDEQNRELLERINRSGVTFLSHTVLNGRLVLRLAIGHYDVRWQDLEQVWKHIQAITTQLTAS
jgi:aromatic-L-amino-acid/L-tryptophan decarboxylase